MMRLLELFKTTQPQAFTRWNPSFYHQSSIPLSRHSSI